jgi:hypothetical protein
VLVIEPDIIELMESPCSLIVGTVDANGLPDATRGWGLQVLDGGSQVRLLLSANAEVTRANLRDTRRIALTATDFATMHSVQVKGAALAVEDATDADRARFEKFWADCARTLHELDGTPEATIARMVPSGVFACIMTVDDLFDQTPGPEAGTRLSSAKDKS